MIKTYIILREVNPPIHITNDKLFEKDYLNRSDYMNILTDNVKLYNGNRRYSIGK